MIRASSLFTSAALVTVTGALVTTGSSPPQGGPDAAPNSYVRLQGSTPGMQQTGHLNIRGTGLFGGDVGIGTATPSAKLHAETASGTCVYGVSAAATGIGVFGLVTGTPTGSDENFGVWGEATAASGYTYGLWGEVASTAGTGALGCATATTGFNWGVVGLSYSTGGTGVYGAARAGSGTTYGVWGTSLSGTGYGVYGSVSSGTQNAGVYGVSVANNGNGLIAEANTGTSAFAIWGKSASGYAGYFSGNVNVAGTLSKSAGAFKIDHPLDPENKYLYHSFVESPDMKNLYDGVVGLDAAGEAWVQLPDWFEAVNKDFRYQLTAIGAPAPNLHIAQKIRNDRFKIAGGQPGMEVSWQVAGIRKDPYAERHRIPVEEEKADLEKGYYLHPELYGLSDEFRIENAKRRSQGIRNAKPDNRR